MNPNGPLIVGGGMAGALLALLLRHHGCPSVTLVESHPLPAEAPPETPSFDARSTALSAGSLKVLEQLGLLAPLLERAASINEVHVSRQGRLGLTRMLAEEHRLPRLGAVVENRWLGYLLVSALYRDDAIEVRAPDGVEAARRVSDGYIAKFNDGGERHTPLLIAADGANSRTRDWLGITARQQDIGHDALIANVAVAEPHKGRAFERFLDDGPMALLPLPDQRMALVWTGPRDQVDAWMAMDDTQALDALHQRMGAAPPALTAIGERHRYPLVLTEACAQAVPFGAVVGNAAHTLHPVAGQGFNLSVRDLAALAEAVGGTAHPGELACLSRWQQARRADQAWVTQASRQLPEWFRVRQPLFAHSRQLGLLALDLLPGPRRDFARRAMGLQ
ncbi:oxygenase [Alcanivorax xiamenensis]|uniref:Oxygenase n=1 Tax=Alcanivorax xiamenensis TaxID=1177156 RepID=A0ABQ6Y5Q6_9GAMM|nr:FAD-dependent monooxygenase [Alcanivorax xiamenensis]KAF0804607.1 oxygenase [Alcanivorax xiamenensis]